MSTKLFPGIAILFLLSTGTAGAGPELSATSINDATWPREGLSKVGEQINPAVVKIEVLLARSRFSPGEIDGRLGENLKKAMTAYADENHLDTGAEQTVWDQLASGNGDPIVADYVITGDDLKGPFIEKIPAKMEDMKDLEYLGYRSPVEALAEKFHMSETLLKALNPGKHFDQAGETLSVPIVQVQTGVIKVKRIQVDIRKQTLRALDDGGKLIAFYPATVGSEEKPAPLGNYKVKSVTKYPTYHYNPKFAFKGVKTDKPFTIAKGPNNPVGAVWIDLSAPSYGIHGTPEPSKVSKTESHGCIRLTNWDVLQLASMVRKGASVSIAASGKDEATSSAKKKRK